MQFIENLYSNILPVSDVNGTTIFLKSKQTESKKIIKYLPKNKTRYSFWKAVEKAIS